MNYTRLISHSTKSNALSSKPVRPTSQHFEGVLAPGPGPYRPVPSAAIAAALTLLLLVRTAGAAGWTLTSAPPMALWTALACSADGRNLAAASRGAVGLGLTNGGVYTSTNYGQTWALAFTGPFIPNGVAASADGSKLVVITRPAGVGEAPIYLSSDSGATWTQARGPLEYWGSVASSADGATVLAGGSYRIFLSTNAGATWVSNNMESSSAPYFVASSADGTKLFVASGNSGLIYASTNSGASWVSHLMPSPGLFQIACSADGRKLLEIATCFIGVGYHTNQLYTSADFGVTWRAKGLPGYPSTARLAASADGKVLVYAGIETERASGIYVSTDGGAHWVQTDAPVTNWWPFAASADGHRLYAAGQVAGIYSYYSPQNPTLDIGVSPGTLELSWLVPSTSFVLQQAAGLENPTWGAVTNAPVLNLTNLHYEITAPAANRKALYRLATP